MKNEKYNEEYDVEIFLFMKEERGRSRFDLFLPDFLI